MNYPLRLISCLVLFLDYVWHCEAQCSTTVTWVLTASRIEKLDSMYLLGDQEGVPDKDACIALCNANLQCVGVQYALDNQNICQLMGTRPPVDYEIMMWNDNMLYDMYEKVCGTVAPTRTICNMTALPTETLLACSINSPGCTQLADIHTVTDIRGCEHWCRVGYQSFVAPGECKAYVVYRRIIANITQSLLKCRLYGETTAIVSKPTGSNDQAFARTCYTITPPKIPTPCYYTDWTENGPCSKSCGGGVISYSRLRVDAEPGGAPCADNNLPLTLPNQPCNTAVCPKDCVVGPWTNVGDCSVTCGGGSQQQTRVITQPSGGGQACPTDVTQRTVNNCGLGGCPVDCVVGPWISQGGCSLSCGGGVQQQTRTITQAQNGGRACTTSQRTRPLPCNDQPCPVNCFIGIWVDDGLCSAACGGGTLAQTRTVVQASNGGTACPANTASTRNIQCNTQVCATDCTLGPWSDVTSCTVTCGGGSITQQRTVTQATGGGIPCGPGDTSSRTIPCNTQGCPTDCQVGPWTNNGACSASCGPGTIRQVRTIVQATNGGTPCDPTLASQKTIGCNLRTCPLDCSVGAWVNDGGCSAPCGGGQQTQTRTVVQAQNGGQACTAAQSKTTQQISCNTQACPVDCFIGAWRFDGACTVTCGGGTRLQIRTVTQAQNGGTPCPAGTTTTRDVPCNGNQCPVDCFFTAWVDSTGCSVTCGTGGTKTQVRQKVPAQNGGQDCPNEPVTKQVFCSSAVNCPVDCVVSGWSEGSCSVTCGGGIKLATRNIITAPANGGQQCPATLQENRPCNSQACPINCQLGPWISSGICTKTCGTGQQKQIRSIAPAQNGGNPCSETTTERFSPCNTFNCPIDCFVGPWVNDGGCSATCGGGQRNQKREIRQAQFNGVACDPGALTTRQLDCNTQGCPVDCQVGSWSNAGGCTATCGGGQQQQTRTIIRAQNGGQDCNQQACPTPCFIGAWQNQGSCSVTCGAGGQQSQVREVRQPTNGGTPCPANTQTTRTVPCSGGSCPIDCVFGQWLNAGACSVTCDAGVQLQTRTKIEAQNGGNDCVGDLRMERVISCNLGACPVHCVMSNWTDVSTCSASCGSGTKTQQRNMTPASNGGIPCADTSTTQTVACTLNVCPPAAVLRTYIFMEENVTESSKYSFDDYTDKFGVRYSQSQCEILCDTQPITDKCDGILYNNETMQCVLLRHPGTITLYPDNKWCYWIPKPVLDADMGTDVVDKCNYGQVTTGWHGDVMGVAAQSSHKVIAAYSSKHCEWLCRMHHLTRYSTRVLKRCTAYAFGYTTSYFHPLNTVCYLYEGYSGVGTNTGQTTQGTYWLYAQNCQYIV